MCHHSKAVTCILLKYKDLKHNFTCNSNATVVKCKMIGSITPISNCWIQLLWTLYPLPQHPFICLINIISYSPETQSSLMYIAWIQITMVTLWNWRTLLNLHIQHNIMSSWCQLWRHWWQMMASENSCATNDDKVGILFGLMKTFPWFVWLLRWRRNSVDPE